MLFIHRLFTMHFSVFMITMRGVIFMKHKFLSITIILLLLLSFLVCFVFFNQQQNSTQVTSQTKPVAVIDNYWHLACKNTNVVFYKNLSGSQGLEFELVTAFPFEDKELKVDVEFSVPGVSYQVDCYKAAQEEEEVFPFYLYQCYQGMDWKHMRELAEKLSASGGENNEIVQEFGKIQDMYLEEYQSALNQDKLPKLYRYMVGVNFDLDEMNSVALVNAINVTLRGETKQYVLDNLVLDGEREFQFENIGISTSFGIFDAPIYISNDGILDLTYFDLQSKQPFTLTELSILGENSESITDCSVILTQPDGTETEMKWNCKTPMQVMEGESVRIQAFCKDPTLAGVMEAATSKYVMLKYLSADGKEYTEIIQGIYRMRQGLYDLYSVADDINVLSYYLDYQSLNSDMIHVD